MNEVTLDLGEVHAAPAPTLVKTRLGAGIAVCLYDPVRAVGGMNHFMLPGAPAAMEQLLGTLEDLGGTRRRLVAKVYGGAHLVGIDDATPSAPERVIAFTMRFLEAGGIPVAATDVGGHKTRQVHFQSATGRVLLRRVPVDRPAPHDGAVAAV